MIRTNADIQKTVRALEWLGNQPAGKNAKAPVYNAFQLRVQLHIEAYRPMSTAIAKTEKSLFVRFEKEAGDELKYLENGNVSFGIRADRDYKQQAEELMEAAAEEEPKRKAFVVTDFESVGIFVPQSIMDDLGSLFTKPADYDPDAIGANVTEENAD